MLAITAIIRVKRDCEGAMRSALQAVADHASLHEPETVGFFVCQDSANPSVFTTYERFTDQAAMDRHNNSATVAKFFGIAKPLLDGEVTLIQSRELFPES